MNWKKDSWSTSILSCPHCDEKINIKSKSIISEKAMISQLYNQYKLHSCNKFFLDRKKIQLNVQIKSTSMSSEMFKTEWEYHNIILV
jgi:hypothetical protein